MTKDQAIALLGGSKAAAAMSMGITRQALNRWPDEGELPQRLADRVQAALWRESQRRSPPRRGNQATETT